MMRGKVKTFFSVLLVAMLINHMGLVQADKADNYWSELNRSSDTILQYVKQQQYEEAIHLLDDFSNMFLEFTNSDKQLSMNELQVITATYDETVHAVKSTSLSHEKRVQKAYKLRLLMDVYVDSHEPLWKSMKSSVMNSLVDLRVDNHEEEQLSKQQLASFVAQFETLKPAWSVILQDDHFQRVQSQMQFLINSTESSVKKSEWNGHIDLMIDEFTQIFDGVEQEDVSDPSFYWLIVTVSGAIFSSLTYAGWKKYKAYDLSNKRSTRRRKGRH